MSRATLEAMHLFVELRGVRYACERKVRYTTRGAFKFWRCGRCDRGKLQKWDKECKVCHAKVIKLAP